MKSYQFINAALLLGLLSACEYSLMDKDRSEFLIEGQRLYYNTQDYQRVREKYLQAYQSSDVNVKAYAAYELASLAEDYGRYDEQIAYLEKAFEYNHSGSQVRLGNAYLAHQPTPKNITKAYHIFREYEDRSVDANLSLATLALRSNKTDAARKHLVKAEDLLSSQEDADGQLALKMGRGYQVFPDKADKASLWYQNALTKRHPGAPAEYARFLMRDGDPSSASFKKGFALLDKEARGGNIGAIEGIAKVYRKSGQIDQAIAWYEKLEAYGDTDGRAALALAKLYEKKTPNQLNPQAKKWFDKSIGKGNEQAYALIDKRKQQHQLRLAKQAERAAKEAARKAKKLQKGLQQPVSALLMTENGPPYKHDATYRQVGHQKIYASARKNQRQYGNSKPALINQQLELAAHYGSAKAAFDRAKGASDNRTLATKWYEKAASLGHHKSMLYLARNYGLNGNVKKSFIWYEKAAKAGNAEGQYQLGVHYARGQGVAKNIQQAKHWLNKAKGNGYKLALKTLQSIE